jgi:hypothetical protein
MGSGRAHVRAVAQITARLMLPGRTLHRLATHLCSATTLERIVEPAIADLQKEYGDARLCSLLTRVRVLVAGYAGIWEGIAMTALEMSSVDNDRRAVASALAWSTVMFITVFALLVLLPLYSFQNIPRGWYAATTLAPQALPLAIPIGIAFGIAFGVHARPATSIRKMMLVSALAASVMSFGILAWAMPAGNQAFKELTLQKLWGSGYHGAITEPWVAHNEMNLANLRQQITKFSERGEPRRARFFGFQFHLRFSLAVATLALVSLLLAVPINHRGLRGMFAFAMCLLYGALLFTGEALAVYSSVAPSVAGTVPPVIGAWLPNIVLVAFAVVIASSRSSRLRVSSASVVKPSDRD